MAESDPRFRWSDGWVFLAIALAGKEVWVTPASVIAAADGIEHAILTREELDGGLRRLCRGGLVEMEDVRCRLTPSGLEVYEQAAEVHCQLAKLLTAVQERLGAQPRRRDDDPAQAARGARLPELISLEVYEAAVKEYLGRAATS